MGRSRHGAHPREESQLKEIAARIQKLRDFLAKRALLGEVNGWYRFLNAVKAIVGNANNDLGFVATLLAKRYLCQRYSGLQFDAAAKSQSAPGLDADVQTLDGKHIVAEIKTTFPYQVRDVGANQRKSFLRDCEKLAAARAEFKYLFVTEPEAFDVICTKYRGHVGAIAVVCLGDGREFVG